jgi:hypothetical protein
MGGHAPLGDSRFLIASDVFLKEINMTANTPTDRASFNSALSAILAEHATLRHLAATAATRSSHSTDDTMSLADAMTTHERTEAGLFALPFVTEPPKSVTSTGAKARQCCFDYTSGRVRAKDPNAVAAHFIDALLAHLDAEEAWLAHEKEHQHERLSIAA